MADLSDDISSLLHTLLHNSTHPSTSLSSSSPAPTSHHLPVTRQPGSAVFSEPVGLFDSSFGFPGAYYSSGVGGSLGLSMDEINEGDCDSEGQEETHAYQAPARSASKRSRAAEVHNLSEKRRRQRINEKMKALQKLIPNSNKTDKASMLDEAIEYLKQLQLQVQMLTMRNGTSLHPYYLPGVAQPLQPPSIGPLLDEPNNSRGISSFTADQAAHLPPMYDLDSRPGSSDYKHLMPGLSENNSAPSLALEPSMMYRPLSSSMHSKVVRKDPGLTHLQLDMTHCGQSSSSGVSS